MKRSLLPVFCALAASCAQPEPIPDDLSLDERLGRIDRLRSEWESRGASGIVYVSHRGETLYEKGFGSASCTDSEPVTPEHHFMIGSITKEITQLLAYVLVERGELRLTDTLNRHLPEISGDLGAVTLQQLVDHTAGLPDLVDEDGRSVRYRVEYDYEPVTRADLVARAAKVRLEFEPGSKEEYSNLGYQLLAAVYEVATGLSYDELLRRYIFEPGGVRDTAFWFEDNAAREFADGCRRRDVHWGNPIDDGMWGPEGAGWNLRGAGGLISTARSLSRFFEGIGSGAYFETEAGAEAYKSARMSYSDYRQQRLMGPAGSNGIFNAVGLWLDRDRLSIVMFTNRASHQAEDDMVQEVIRLFPPGSLAPASGP